jgi:hypothetical protein
MSKKIDALFANIDKLPDNCVVPLAVYDRVMGISRETRRKNPPPLQKIKRSEGLYGYRAGDIRKLARGEIIFP